MALPKSITIDGEQFSIAPLTIEQVEDHLENTPSKDDAKGWRDHTLQAIANSMNNASHATNGDSQTPATLKKRLNLQSMNELFIAVLEVSGLRAATIEGVQGEAPAAPAPQSTSDTSAAA